MYDGDGILADIEWLVVLVTERWRGGRRGRKTGSELHVEAGTSIVGRGGHHTALDSFPPLLQRPHSGPERPGNLIFLLPLPFIHHHLSILVHPFRINSVYPPLV